MKNKNIKLSIVMPVFNEEQNLPFIVEKLQRLPFKNFEAIFVEDTGSTDNTRGALVALAKQHSFIRNVFITQRGYGISIYHGLKAARGEYMAWTHADLQTDPQDVVKALEILQVQPTPTKTYIKGKRYGRPLFDKIFTWGMNIFETLILGTFLYEINAQPNVFHNSFLRLLKNPPHDFSFDLYTYYIAKKKGYILKRFPVYFGKRVYGESKWNTGLKAKFKFIKRTLQFSFRLKKLLKEQEHNLYNAS